MTLATPPGYQAYAPETLAGYLATVEPVAGRLGGAASAWTIREVGDGNLNLVFIV